MVALVAGPGLFIDIPRRQHLQREGERFGAFLEVLLEKVVSHPPGRSTGECAGDHRIGLPGLEQVFAVGRKDPALPRRKEAGADLRTGGAERQRDDETPTVRDWVSPKLSIFEPFMSIYG